MAHPVLSPKLGYENFDIVLKKLKEYMKVPCNFVSLIPLNHSNSAQRFYSPQIIDLVKHFNCFSQIQMPTQLRGQR